MSEEIKSMTKEDAEKLLEADKQARIKECTKELQLLLEKYKCQVAPSVGFKVNHPPQWSIEIIAI